MTRHASADDIAFLAAGELRRRKAAKVAAHVAGCALCTQVRAQLAEVTATLVRAQYPPLPETVTVTIQAALRSEVNARLAAAPAAEAARRDLPARHRRERSSADQGPWRLPGLSVPATRVLATAGALVIIGGGGYLMASNLTSSVAPSSSSSQALPAPVQSMSRGPDVTYGSPGSQHTIHSVSSSMNFVPGQLRNQALGAYHQAQLTGEAANQASGSANGRATLGAVPTSATTGAAGAAGMPVGPRLAGCIDAVGPGRSVLLVDLAKYAGSPATIIVFGATATSQAEVIVTADTCSAIAPTVLARAPLGHL
jgi:hypothetical protein